MKPYQPSQIVPAGGALLLVLAILIGGAVIGALVSLISNFVYLIFVFPLVMGFIGGGVVAIAVRAGKIRNPGVALLGGVLIGLVIYGSMWTVDYLQFRNAVKSEILKRTPNAGTAEMETYIDKVLVTETGQPGFLGFVLITDQDGVSIGKVGSSNPINLGPTFSWVYWVLELLLIIWLAAQGGRTPAREPFCEACGRWYRKPELLGTLGTSRTKEILGLIEGNQFQRLGEELQSNPALPNVGVFLATCGEDCANGDSYLVTSQQNRNSKGGVVSKDLVKGLITPFQLQDLRRGIAERRSLYGLEPTAPAKS